jgi:hypothetical protein
MTLYHTSPAPITAITEHGRFGSFLFFSGHVYSMTAGTPVVYQIDLDDADVIDAGSLFFHEQAGALAGLVAEVQAMTGCDEDEAEDLISQKTDCGDAEQSWDIQRIAGRAARILGFRAVKMQDEQGAAYLVDMLGRESDLQTA